MTIKVYDSFEEMFEDMEASQVLADSNVQPWQRGLKAGDCFVRADALPGVDVYCEVLPPYDEEDAAMYAEAHMQNYRFCKCYSTMCEWGEMGDVHISTATHTITREEFDAAKERKWR